MRQIKIFKAVETDIPMLEQSINKWIRENNINVVQVFGNICPQNIIPGHDKAVLQKTIYTPADILIVVVYETDELQTSG